jgi:NAD(P)H-dependent flavin oxidoreductase YrpB (nitropropane dioxygenase family)
VLGKSEDGRSVLRYSPEAPKRGFTKMASEMSLYSGQGVGLVTEVRPAADVVREMTDHRVRLLETAGTVVVR